MQCPTAIDTDTNEWESQFGVAMHELAHALGFSSSSWPLFRDQDGTPRTPRDTGYPFQVASQYYMYVNTYEAYRFFSILAMRCARSVDYS